MYSLGQITDLTLPPASFDAATIWHVLEHVPESSGRSA
jgi:2-polyprenyl-3-methyl-5-hydroxy-6-metoxy-1,4-benzoquinol methylase